MTDRSLYRPDATDDSKDETDRVDSEELLSQLADVRRQLRDAKVQLEQLKCQALTDPLTGVRNRRALDEDLERQISEFIRYLHPFSILMIDFDGLKEINDQYGHQAGDQSLINTTQVLQTSIRQCDALYRIGGDEFVMILPETDKHSAEQLSHRLQRDIASSMVAFEGNEISTTISIGIAQVRDGDTAKTLLARADQQLYGKKEVR